MKKIRTNKKGFTLAELLIVVAIIGVLVAISIPIFTSQLEKSREATDLANLRAARAEASAAYLTEDLPSGVKADTDGTYTMYYDAGSGKLVATEGEADAIGKGTAADGGCSDYKSGTYTYKHNTIAKDKKIKVVITKDGGITCSFDGSTEG